MSYEEHTAILTYTASAGAWSTDADVSGVDLGCRPRVATSSVGQRGHCSLLKGDWQSASY